MYLYVHTDLGTLNETLRGTEESHLGCPGLYIWPFCMLLFTFLLTIIFKYQKWSIFIYVYFSNRIISESQLFSKGYSCNVPSPYHLKRFRNLELAITQRKRNLICIKKDFPYLKKKL